MQKSDNHEAGFTLLEIIIVIVAIIILASVIYFV